MRRIATGAPRAGGACFSLGSSRTARARRQKETTRMRSHRRRGDRARSPFVSSRLPCVRLVRGDSRARTTVVASPPAPPTPEPPSSPLLPLPPHPNRRRLSSRSSRTVLFPLPSKPELAELLVRVCKARARLDDDAAADADRRVATVTRGGSDGGPPRAPRAVLVCSPRSCGRASSRSSRVTQRHHTSRSLSSYIRYSAGVVRAGRLGRAHGAPPRQRRLDARDGQAGSAWRRRRDGRRRARDGARGLLRVALRGVFYAEPACGYEHRADRQPTWNGAHRSASSL